MKKLFLTSSVDNSIQDMLPKINLPGAKVLFVDTAAEPIKDDKSWLKKHRQSLLDAGFRITDFTLTGKTKDQIRDVLAAHDVLYMGGGNVLYLLYQIQTTDCADLIREFVVNGHVYIGSSAGSIIAAPDVSAAYTKETAKAASLLKDFRGLSLVDFMVLPHWGSAAFEPVYFNERLKRSYTENDKLIPLTDYQYIEVKDEMYCIIDVKYPRPTSTNN